MCFSPEASFTASVALFLISAITIRKLLTSPHPRPQHWALVAVPLGFAIQQFSEGLIWLSLLKQFNPVWQSTLVSIFIFFAFIFWPAYIPTCLAYFEISQTRKLILQILTGVGLSTATILLTSSLYFGISAQISSCHILYTLNLGHFESPWTYLLTISYLLATVGAPLICSNRNMQVLGFLTGLAYLISYIFFFYYLTSVWCFFAALISLLIYLVIVKDLRK